MAQWWTYRLSDFLMFSVQTWHRLFERYNAELWPAQIIALGLGVGMGIATMRISRVRDNARTAAAVFGGLALAWIWVGWAFHVQRYATINWAALWFGVVFVVQGLLLLAGAWRVGSRPAVVTGRAALADRAARGAGPVLLLFALVVQPLVGLALGRSWRQIEVFGITPDPTVSATLGLLLMLQPLRPFGRWSWILWLVPLLWCVVAGATAWTLHLADAWLMPAVAIGALAAALRTGRRAAGSA